MIPMYFRYENAGGDFIVNGDLGKTIGRRSVTVGTDTPKEDTVTNVGENTGTGSPGTFGVWRRLDL